MRGNGVGDKAKMARRRRKDAGFVPISHARAYYIMRSPLLLVFLQIERNAAQVNSTAYKRTSPNNSRRHRLTNSSTQKTSNQNLIHSKTHPLQSSPTQMFIHLKAYPPPKLIRSPTHPLKKPSTPKAHSLEGSPTQRLIHSNTHPLQSSSTRKVTNSETHQLRNSPTHPLRNLKKTLFLFYNVTLILAPF